jgi:monovalent cation:H+ antiporter-2, CPA2 family
MEHQATLLLTIVLGLVVAFVFGFLATKVRLPPLVGYLVAGIAIGPFAPGVSADTAMASQLSEVGVILLMFGVGLHFSTADLLAVKWIAVPGCLLNIVITTLIGTALATAWGWSFGSGLVLGLSLSVASTVVVLRALEERGTLASGNGRIAIGWLIVEDLAMVLVLVLLPALAGLLGGHAPAGDGHGGGASETSLAVTLALTFGKLALFGVILAFVGPRFVPWLLGQAARSGSHELFTLSVLAIALGIAYGSSAFFSVSFALGAFAAGIVLSKSELSHRAAAESLPLQHAFAVLFFVSVGMLVDPTVVLRAPLQILAVLAIVLIGKTTTAFTLSTVLGYPVSTAVTMAASLAMVGEFSFILAALGMSLGLLTPEARDLILAAALVSITLNKLAFLAVDPVTNWLRKALGVLARGEPARAARLERLEQELARSAAHEAPANRSLEPSQLMNKFPVFAELDGEQRAELLTLFKPKTASPGDRVIKAGDVGDEMFFISSGAVEVSIGGRKIPLGPGDFFGEMALLTGERRVADVTAIDYCLFLTLEKGDFDQFIGRHPHLRAGLDRVAAERAAKNRRQQDDQRGGA